jgi:hypothetical protein
MNCDAADPVPWPFAYTRCVTNTESRILNVDARLRIHCGGCGDCNAAVWLCDGEVSEMEGEMV